MLVRAIEDFYYAGDRKRGEVFEMEEGVILQLLTQNGKIESVEQQQLKRKDMEAKRRDYRRRDMRADE